MAELLFFRATSQWVLWTVSSVLALTIFWPTRLKTRKTDNMSQLYFIKDKLLPIPVLRASFGDVSVSCFQSHYLSRDLLTCKKLPCSFPAFGISAVFYKLHTNSRLYFMKHHLHHVSLQLLFGAQCFYWSSKNPTNYLHLLYSNTLFPNKHLWSNCCFWNSHSPCPESNPQQTILPSLGLLVYCSSFKAQVPLYSL